MFFQTTQRPTQNSPILRLPSHRTSIYPADGCVSCCTRRYITTAFLTRLCFAIVYGVKHFCIKASKVKYSKASIYIKQTLWSESTTCSILPTQGENRKLQNDVFGSLFLEQMVYRQAHQMFRQPWGWLPESLTMFLVKKKW